MPHPSCRPSTFRVRPRRDRLFRFASQAESAIGHRVSRQIKLRKREGPPRPFYLRLANVCCWQCAPKARIISGGRFHPESCRLIRKLTSGLCGQLHGLEPRDKGRLGRLSDPAGRNASEA
jgi:hypothetical protein